MGFIAFVLAVKDRLSTYEKIDKGKGWKNSFQKNDRKNQ
jgi:hypothetical protein